MNEYEPKDFISRVFAITITIKNDEKIERAAAIITLKIDSADFTIILNQPSIIF